MKQYICSKEWCGVGIKNCWKFSLVLRGCFCIVSYRGPEARGHETEKHIESK